MTEKVLALDLSTKTGWAVLLSNDKDFAIEDYGRLEKISEPTDEGYPGSYVSWAYLCFNKVLELIELYKPDRLVIEETSGGSKSAYSQKILEYLQFLVARYIKESGVKSTYYQTETWRRIVGCVMSPEEKKKNKLIRTTKKNNRDIKVVKVDGKRIGIVGRKHVNVRKANELAGKWLREPIILAQEDRADAILLGIAYHMKRIENETK